MKDPAYSVKLEQLSVGYNGKALIHDISLSIGRGEIVTLIGPNGAGKSTILKSITRQLEAVAGTVRIEEKDLSDYTQKDLSLTMAVMLTERIRPELMTCFDVAATGRYPYTGKFGVLTEKDEKIVEDALKLVQADGFAFSDFTEISDGQKQLVLLARAIAQEPEIIVLDEPTSFLDIKHKIDFLKVLRSMAREKGVTVILSLHEIDLALKVSDHVLCVKGETVYRYDTPEALIRDDAACGLYDLEKGQYDMRTGNIDLGDTSEPGSTCSAPDSVSGIPENGSRFYANRDCRYFPCHETEEPERFNCLFCYCPLYMLGKDCGGHFRYNEKGYKDCTGCMIPHDPENYDYMMQRCAEVAKRMKNG